MKIHRKFGGGGMKRQRKIAGDKGMQTKEIFKSVPRTADQSSCAAERS